MRKSGEPFKFYKAAVQERKAKISLRNHFYYLLVAYANFQIFKFAYSKIFMGYTYKINNISAAFSRRLLKFVLK